MGERPETWHLPTLGMLSQFPRTISMNAQNMDGTDTLKCCITFAVVHVAAIRKKRDTCGSGRFRRR